MKLFILRHGKSVEHTVNQKDYDRPLAEKGQKQIKKIRQYLNKYHIKSILSSSAQRTFETTKIVNNELHLDSVIFEEALYLANVSEIHSIISNFNAKDDFLIVGHNFGISQIIEYYSGEHIQLSTGMLAIIEFNYDSSEMFTVNSGRLLKVVSPKQL